MRLLLQGQCTNARKTQIHKHQFSCASFCGSVLQLQNVNVKTMIWKYCWLNKSDLCSCPIKYSNPYFNYYGSKLFTPFAIGITVTNSITIPKNSVRHLPVKKFTLPSMLTTCFWFHGINNVTTRTTMHFGGTLMTHLQHKEQLPRKRFIW